MHKSIDNIATAITVLLCLALVAIGTAVLHFFIKKELSYLQFFVQNLLVFVLAYVTFQYFKKKLDCDGPEHNSALL